MIGTFLYFPLPSVAEGEGGRLRLHLKSGGGDGCKRFATLQKSRIAGGDCRPEAPPPFCSACAEVLK
jgi:hypothetical protein